MKRHTKRFNGFSLRGSGALVMIWLLVCFAGGILAGFFAQRMALAPATAEVQRYLSACGDSAESAAARLSIGEALFLYYRYPLAVVLLGTSLFGVAAIPLLCAMQGFSLSFAACCFASAMGNQGVVLALASFGIRALVTIPCTMTLGCAAWPVALHLARSEKVTPGEGDRRCATVCFFLLLLGVVLELTVVPYLFSASLAAL